MKAKIEFSNHEKAVNGLLGIKSCGAILGHVVWVQGGRCFGKIMIDWLRVEDLKREIGIGDFGEVMALFLEEADEVVARLPKSITAKSLESDLHFLKGSALNIGFTDLAQICQVGERKAAAGNTDIAVDQVQQVYANSRATFLDKLGGIEAA